MKFTCTQKATILKELSEMCSMPRAVYPTDKDFFKMLKGKYACWDSIHYTEEVAEELRSFVNNVQTVIGEHLVEITNDLIEVNVSSNNVSCPTCFEEDEKYLSSDLTVFEDENTLVEDSLDQFKDAPTFTGFCTDDFQQTNAIYISPQEFWSDEEPSVSEDDF